MAAFVIIFIYFILFSKNTRKRAEKIGLENIFFKTIVLYDYVHNAEIHKTEYAKNRSIKMTNEYD